MIFCINYLYIYVLRFSQVVIIQRHSMRSNKKNTRQNTQQRAQELSSSFTPFSFQNSSLSFTDTKKDSQMDIGQNNNSKFLNNNQNLPFVQSNAYKMNDIQLYNLQKNTYNRNNNYYDHQNYQVQQGQFFRERQHHKHSHLTQLQDKMRIKFLDMIVSQIGEQYLKLQKQQEEQQQKQEQHLKYLKMQRQKQIMNAIMQKKKKSYQNRSIVFQVRKQTPIKVLQIKEFIRFNVIYEIQYVRIDTGLPCKQNKGKFNIGQVNPYKQSTISKIVDMITQNIEGIIHKIVQKVIIDDGLCQIFMKIILFVEPISLHYGLSCCFQSFDNQIIKGLKIRGGNVTINWHQQISSNGFDLKDEVQINGYNVALSQRLCKKATIIFRCMQFEQQQQNCEGFLQLLQVQCPNISRNLIKSALYDKILNIGIIELV